MQVIEMLERRLLLSRTWIVATNGNDADAGTLASPLRTIQKAASIAQPGDTVSIRAGTYRETVTPAHSGTAGAPITFVPYNSEKVTVSGADPITAWSQYNGSIYDAGMSWDLGAGNNQIIVNGKMVNEARWPNTVLQSHIPFATASWVNTTSLATGYAYPDIATLGASGLPGGAGAWKGATIHIASGQAWNVQTGTVLSSAPGQLTYTFEHLTAWESPAAGARFYLTGTFQALDAPAEWYRDPTTSKLYLWTPNSTNPSANVVEAKHRQFAFELSNRAYITVQGISLFAASIDTSSASNHLLLGSLNAQYVSQQMLNPIPWDDHNRAATSGILLNGTNNLLQNSTIAYSSGDGVYLGGSFNTVQNCTISDVDYGGGDESGIEIGGSHQQVLHCTIFNAGRSGITDSFSTANTIEYNTIHDVGLQTTDLGGIYDWGTSGGGTVIAYNTIYNVHGGGFGGAGAYLDNGSQGFVVHDNKIYNVDHPIKINPPAWNNQIYSNNISGSGSQISNPQQPGNAAPVAGITDLGTLGGFRSVANAINNDGQIVGNSLAGASAPVFYYYNGVAISLGALGGNDAVANAINASGQIVGSAYAVTGAMQAFLYIGGRMTRLGTLPGDVSSSANGINTSGKIVGTSYSAGAIGRAFIYAGGVMQAIPGFGDISMATGINASGVVVGAMSVAGDQNEHAFYYSNGRAYDVGTLGGSASYATAINDDGMIVGTSTLKGDGTFHAFSYSLGKIHDIGALPGFSNSVATSVNSAGDIVGYCYTNPTGMTHAFYYHDGVMTDLARMASSTPWVLTDAFGINDKRQVVGTGYLSNGYRHAFLLQL